MPVMVFLIPLLALLLSVTAMGLIIWKFIHFRWANLNLRNAMARFWNEDRRTVLHLESQNGFIVLSELLIRQSEWRMYARDKKALFLMSLGFFIVLALTWFSYSFF